MNVSISNRTFFTPNSSILNSSSTSFSLERSLSLNKNRRDVRKSKIWGSVNFLVMSILLYDISYSCPLYLDYFDYIKYGILFIVTMNLLYYAAKILISHLNHEQIPITLEQKKLLGISDSDPNYKIVTSLENSMIQTPNQSFTQSLTNTPSLSSTSTPMNMTALSWRSNLTPNESLNYSLPSPSWTYHKVKADSSPSILTPNSPNIQYRDTSGLDLIANDEDLDKYLKEFEANTSVKNLSNQTQKPSNLLSSFWSHPVTKTAKDMSSFLKRCTYQLSSQSPNLSPNTGSKLEGKASPTNAQTSVLVPWTRIDVDIVALTQWNENLRKWISQTILDRLVKEFDRINESFEKQGLSDVKIGCVGLDRLRKTAQIAHVTHFIPSLPSVIPFLEVTSNQEYLVKRIRELAKGGCMSEFKWNGGSSYNGKEWDESLPTDSAIVMHLLASYLDTQLSPLPSMPDTKPFSGLYYIKCRDKMPTLTPNSLFIQQVSEKPPHYRVIVGETIYEMVKGYSNLFHSILFFLYYVNKQEHAMLGRVNLGRAGINMLWIIEK